MKKLKLFPKIFLYTFLVMLLVTLASHLFLYMFAPQMQINASRFLENGVMMETTLNTEWIIQDAIFKAVAHLLSLLCSCFSCMLPDFFQSDGRSNQTDFQDHRTDGMSG